MAQLATRGIGDNGGPPLGAPVPVYFGEKYMPLFSRYRHKVFYGGRGSGKSHAIATALAIIASKHGVLVVCARQYQNSIKTSVKELIENKIKMLGLAGDFKFLEREIINEKTGAKFIFIGLDRNPESAKSLEGADICWVEEANTINARSMEILEPTIRKPGSEIWWSYNPEFTTDPVDNYFRGGALPEGAVFVPPPDSYICRVGIEDNPWFYQTEMPQQMWHMEQGNPARFRHVWGGEYDEDYEGRIYSDVMIGRVDVPANIDPRYGMDFSSGGAHPHAILRAYVLDHSKQIYIAREAALSVPMRHFHAAIDSVIDTRADQIVCDSSQPGTIEQLNFEGFNCVPAKKGPGSVKAGITWLQGYQLVIDPDCPLIAKEARTYSWAIDRVTKKRTDAPVKVLDDLLDALRYATEDAQTNPAPSADGGVLRINFGGRRRR